ncbi:MAG: RpiB/LacA/LacB family sugar-phosphate isomerase [Rhodopseudomonas palustris]|nr:RpiB/LacA/LacB family sugar-phosphate isomerase [Rhodopseudomonas palustris]
MAEALMRRELDGRPDLRVLSIGLGALDGQPATITAVTVMAEIGLDLSGFVQPIASSNLIEDADYDTTLTRQQQEAIQTFYLAASEKSSSSASLKTAKSSDATSPTRSGSPLKSTDAPATRFAGQSPASSRSSSRPRLLAKSVAENGAPPAASLHVAVAADHGGIALKAALIEWLEQHGYPCADLGAHSTDPVDYPDYAFAVAKEIIAGKFDRPESLSARAALARASLLTVTPASAAALVGDEHWARLGRQHNDANVLVLSAEEGRHETMSAPPPSSMSGSKPNSKESAA